MITVVIPTIGRNKTFYRAFHSAIQVEISLASRIVIIDNSQSTEFTNYLYELAAKNNNNGNRISIISHPERVSMAASWNSSLDSINTKWVIFLHDDDELHDINSNVDTIIKILNEHSNKGFITFDFQCQYQSNILRKNKIKTHHWPKNLNINSIIECPKFVSTIINLEQLIKIHGFSEKYGNFLDLIAFIEMYKTANAAAAPITLGTYHLHEDNESDILKRAAGYGNFIPETCKKAFELYEEAQIRYNILKSILDFAYPKKQSLTLRILKKFRLI